MKPPVGGEEPYCDAEVSKARGKHPRVTAKSAASRAKWCIRTIPREPRMVAPLGACGDQRNSVLRLLPDFQSPWQLSVANGCPDPDLNRDIRFRKPLFFIGHQCIMRSRMECSMEFCSQGENYDPGLTGPANWVFPFNSEVLCGRQQVRVV
jgi:hypothetical protein